MDTNNSDRLEHLEDRFAQLVSTNEFFNQTLKKILEKLDEKEQVMVSAPVSPLRSTAPSIHDIATNHTSRKIKPSPPPDFSGDRSKGRAFLNSCELYLRLASHQFDNETSQIAWVYSFMKTGRAALFVDRVLRIESRTGTSRYSTWKEFRQAFQEEFFPKNERQRALTRLETNSYHQNKRSMDEYVDEFKDLIDVAGYSEGLAIVMKFRKGLRRDIQDQIAQLAHGRPDDGDPSAWYNAALCCAENLESNALFHGAIRPPATTSTFRSFAPTPPQSQTFSPSRIAPAPQARTPQYPVPMDIDATKKKASTPEVCYRCGEPGHRKPDCPRRFDIRHMTMDECEEWMQEKVLRQDAEEIARKESSEEKNEIESDF